jgi:vitamin B12 transporter
MEPFLVAAFLALQDPEQERPIPPKDPIVITATKTEVRLGDLPFALEHLPREQILAEDMDTLTEVLRGTPGVHIVNNGTRGYNVSIFTRGTDSSHTLVLIDGFKLNRDGDSFFEMEMFSPHDLESANLHRGPGSSLYGSGALGGTVGLETLRGKGEPRFSGSISFGSFATSKVEVLTSGESNGLGFTISGYHLEQRDGQFHHSDVLMYGAAARIDLTLSPDASLKVVARGVRTDREIYSNGAGPLLDPLDENAFAEEELGLFGAELSFVPARRWQIQVRAGAYALDRLSSDGADAFDVFGDTRFDTFYDRLSGEVQAVFEAAQALRFTGGVEVTDEDFLAESEFFGFTRERGHRTNRGIFVQAEAGIGTPLSAVLSGRHDRNSFFGSEATWRGALAYAFRSIGTRVRGSWGTAITSPSFLDLLPAFFGNPDLVAEEGQGGDIGLDQDLIEGSLRIGLTGFYNSIKNLIQFSGGGLDNVGRARTSGLEFSAEFGSTAEGWFARAGYTLLRAKDEDTGENLIRRPRHSARLGTGYRGREYRAWIDVVYVGEREDINFSTFARERVDAFFKVDLAASLELGGGSRMTLRVENLLDESYEEVRGFPGAEFNAMVGFEIGASTR